MKLKRIWHIIRYYHIIELLCFALLLFPTYKLIHYFVCFLTKTTSDDFLYSFWELVIALLLIALWIITALLIIKQQTYRYKTDRNYLKDHRRYRRSYRELQEYFKYADPHKLDTSSFPIRSWYKSTGIIFGVDDSNRLIHIPSNSECNIAVFGPPGSGKTSGLAIINAMTFDGSVLAVDIKGDIYNFVSKHTNRKILRFCPDHPNALLESATFDPLSNINKMTATDKRLYLSSMATILIPDESGEAGSYFSSRAQKMFQGISYLLLEEDENTSFPDIIHAILGGNIFDWIARAKKSKCQESKEFLSSFDGNSEKNITSAYDALTTALVEFSNPVLDQLLQKNSRNISIDHLEQGTDIYLQIAQEHLDTYAPLFTLIIQSFSTAFTKRPDTSTGINNRPILMILDEFPQLTFSYKLINANLSTLRSKSVICMIIQQNLSQTEYRYQAVGARSIIGNCNYQIILGSNDINSSKTFSETFGTRKVLKISNSETESSGNSIGRSIQEATELIFPPEHFGDLPSYGKMIIYFKGKYCECNKLNCYRDRQKITMELTEGS